MFLYWLIGSDKGTTQKEDMNRQKYGVQVQAQMVTLQPSHSIFYQLKPN